METCKLCENAVADKTNSHIIPKFLTYSLYEGVSPKHSLEFSIDSEKSNKRQDTPKEDYILCSSCENRFALIEDHFAREIPRIHNYKSYPKEFFYVNYQGTKLIECKNIHPTLFKLFFYSIIWRCSISSHSMFLTYKINPTVLEQIRVFLNCNLKLAKVDLVNNLNNATQIPDFHLCILKSMDSQRSSGEMLAAYSSKEGKDHMISLLKFVILFYEEGLLSRPLQRISNKQNKTVIIGTGEKESWDTLLAVQIDRFNAERVTNLNSKIQKGSIKNK